MLFEGGDPAAKLQPEVGDRGICRCGQEVVLVIKTGGTTEGTTEGAWGAEVEWLHVSEYEGIESNHHPELS